MDMGEPETMERIVHGNRLARNLLNLAGQVLAGQFGTEADFDEARLHNQVMRLWRRADFTPPGGTLTLVRGIEPYGSVTVGVGATNDATRLDVVVDPRCVHAPDHCHTPDECSTGSTTTSGEVSPPKEERHIVSCPEKRRHGPLKRVGRTCPTCGYPNDQVVPDDGEE